MKPVKSWFSQYARAVRDLEELGRYLADRELQQHLTEFTRAFNQLLRRYPELSINASQVMGEALLEGLQVTVEGYVLGERVGLIGIVDSIMYPSTNSFAQFVYPSSLDSATAGRLVDIVTRAVSGLGLRWTLFNVELIFDPTSGAGSRPRGEPADVRSIC